MTENAATLVKPPANRDALLAASRQARSAGRFPEAIGLAKQALALNQEDREAFHQVSLALASVSHRFEDALLWAEDGCRRFPDHAPSRMILAGQYRLANRFEEAMAQCRKAIELAPNDIGGVLNLGLIHRDLGDDDAALGCFLSVLGRAPAFAEAHLGVAEILLSRGEWDAGWLEYEARLAPEREVRGGDSRWPEMAAPKWNGMALPRGRILLIADQGYGDVIQFARFIPMVAERFHEVAMLCDAALEPLLRDRLGIASFTNDWRNVPPHTVWCRVSSLPALFDTRPSTIPATGPYIQAPPDRVAKARDVLRDQIGGHGRTVGLIWSGRPTHGNDRRRSIAFPSLRPLFDSPGTRFVSLQKPVPDRDQAAVDATPALWRWPTELRDFGDTAAIIANLDLVISVDSAVAHLAASMGKPTWILLPKICDWRWLRDTDRSPWYPTVRLFRQTVAGDWEAPIRAMAAELAGGPAGPRGTAR